MLGNQYLVPWAVGRLAVFAGRKQGLGQRQEAAAPILITVMRPRKRQ